MSVLLVAVAAVLAVTIAGAVLQEMASRRDRRRFPPPGRLVDVGGHRLHLHVTGTGTSTGAGTGTVRPTVVLEAGMASMSANWAWVQTDLERDGRVVSYDRAGLGWSERGTRPVDAGTSAEDLHAALRAADVPPPYVLAGHSYGGLVVRIFADRYPGEVVGLALVDSSHPDQWVHIPASRGGRTVAFGNRFTAVLARLGVVRLLRLERPYIAGLPAREYAEMRAYLARPQGWAAGARGLDAWRLRSRSQLDAAKGLGDLPLVVISVTDQARYAEVLTGLQDELVALSSHARHITVAGATHYTLVSEREHAAVVSEAIRSLVERAYEDRGPAGAVPRSA
jgi:pimeloyl-ACP methyl ester carboxylesterase